MRSAVRRWFASVCMLGGALPSLAACGDSATAPPAANAMLALPGTTFQFTIVGTAVPIAPGVKVISPTGDPVANVVVNFTLDAADGSVANASAVTDASGIASTGSWTVGTRSGGQSVMASSPSLRASNDVEFRAQANPGPPVRLVAAPTSIFRLADTTVQLSDSGWDQYGNFYSNPPTTWSSGDNAIATVNSDGLLATVSGGATSITVSSGIATATVPVTVLGVEKTALAARPFGLAISSHDVLYVTHPQDAELARYDLPSLATSGSVTGVSVPRDVAFLPDGSKAYIMNYGDSTIAVVDVATNTRIAAIPVVGSAMRARASADGSKIYATAAGGFLYTVDVATNTTKQLALDSMADGIALSPTQPLIYVTSQAGMLFEVDRIANAVTRNVAIGGKPQDIVVTADGGRLFIADENGPLRVFSTASLTEVATVPAASHAFGVAILNGLSRLVVVDWYDSHLWILDLNSYAVLITIDGGHPRRVASDPSGKIAIVSDEDGFLTKLKWP